MEWSTGVARVQAQWRNLLEEDPDQAIEALSGMSVHARARAHALVTLAERHTVGGGQLVDSGLQAFQETAGGYVEIASFQLGPKVPQVPPGAPPPKTPRTSQMGASAPGTQGNSGLQASSGQQDPWRGWHSGCLVRTVVEWTALPHASQVSGSSVYNSADQAAAKGRGVQPGTRSTPQAATSTSERRSPQAPVSEHRLMPNMTGVPSEAWGRHISYCHGAPVWLPC